VVVLGPEKLPETMASIFKYLRKIGNFISETKESIDRELQII
jgi:Sec-independent protein translocase protein TatA